MFHRSRIFVLLALAGFLPLPVLAEDRIEFNRDIRPILSDNCFYCHGFDGANRKADLRLDTFEAATEYAIVPGEPEDSELLRRMLSDDASEIMPPPETEKSLTPEQIDLVRRWIKQDAAYQEHWAWMPLPTSSPEALSKTLPGSANQSQASSEGDHPIDQFLQQRWAEAGVEAVAQATPRQRLRRLSFDLRGLPPTAKEVATFESNPTDQAFFEFRDRWMNELAYAEHQAVRWLDLVRWADTSGFVSDEPIASGAYRAWIIRAIGDNLPFDEFSKWQLAGDLMTDPTDDQLIASGYNRIVNTNCEAGAIEAEQLYKLKGEHVRALGTAWLGMTTGCAECHDHKFDPFSARDYYSLAAFFDDLVEAGVYTPGDRREPLHYVFEDPKKSKVDRDLDRRIDALQTKIAATPVTELSSWETSIGQQLADKKNRDDFAWIPADLTAMRILEGTFETVTYDDRAARQTSAEPKQFRRHHIAETITGYIEPNKIKTNDKQDAWYVDAWIDANQRPEMIGFQISHGDYGRLGWQTANYETYYWGDDSSQTLKQQQRWNDPTRVKRMGDLPDKSGWVRLRVPFDKLIKPQSGQNFEAVGIAWIQTGGKIGWGDSGLELRADKAAVLRLGEVAMRKWWQRPYNRQSFQSRMDLVARAIRTKPDQRDDLQNELVQDAYRHWSQPDRIARLRKLETRLHTFRSMDALPVLVSKQSDTPKTTRLLSRGDYQDESGPMVEAAFPEFLIPDDSAPSSRKETDPLDREDLANFLFDEASSLVARVFVNRMWHQFYGRGISETLEDSGTQGDWPSHVELLDALALEFRQSGWDRNHLVRLLTSADAYSLASVATKELREFDPGNRLHARQGRFRLTAEAVRDSALQVAGLLHVNDQVPTQSFFPYQPDPYWTRSDKVMYGSRHMLWKTSEQADQYQRSIYTFWKRQNIHPTLMAFDAPTRQECTAERNITNTPGQALALLNDPMFVEAARVFAQRLCEETDLSDRVRIQLAFNKALQRDPLAQESEIMLQLLDQQRQHFSAKPELAAELLSVGQTPPPKETRHVEVAAWTILTRTILNLHEFLNRS